MRNISFALTTEQIKQRTKTVTRRLGWKNLKPGTLLQAVVKGQGLKKGEKVEKLCVIKVVDVREEILGQLKDRECALEGFPSLSADEFILMFCRHNNCWSSSPVTRIEFEYVD